MNESGYQRLEEDPYYSPPIQISWQNLEVSATVASNKKKLLNDVSGSVKPGEFIAIMGPSGAGKTTFLNTIWNRSLGTNVKVTGGKVLYNASDLHSVDIKKFSGFVPQEDVLMDVFTPREVILFSANVRLHHLTIEQRLEKVEKIINDLLLVNWANTTIGNNMIRGISGGERKRTSIGYELIAEPSVLFLDEPTTGLDSFTAVQIIDLIKEQAQRYQRTIMATIHQPSSQIFANFDRLLLLTEGIVVYQGKARDAISFFESEGLPCPENYNPADFFMTILSGHKTEAAKLAGNENAMEAQQISQRISYKLRAESEIEAGLPDLNLFKTQNVSAKMYRETYYLIHREFFNQIKNPFGLAAKVGANIFTALILCAAYFRLGHDTRSVQDRNGLCAMIAVCLSFNATNSNMFPFLQYKPVFEREYASRMYGIFPYYMANSLITLPADLIFGTFTVIIIYWVVGMNPLVDHFFRAVFVMLAISAAGGSIGIMLGTVAKDLATAMDMSVNFLVPFIVWGGLFINIDTIPDWMFYKYISPYRYAFEALARNEYDDLHDMNSQLRHDAVDQLNLKYYYWTDFWVLLVIFLLFRVVSYATCRFINRNK